MRTTFYEGHSPCNQELAFPSPAGMGLATSREEMKEDAMKIQTTVLTLLAVFGLAGCHAHASTSGNAVDARVNTVDADDDCYGVLDCTGELVTDAVLFPFRVLASIF
jgi:hypothetical protein